jgi:hypothetical protein
MSDEDFVAAQAGNSPCVEYVPKTEVKEAFEHGFCMGMFLMTVAAACIIWFF